MPPIRRSRSARECRLPGVSPATPGDGEGFRRTLGLETAEPCLAVLGNVTFGRGQDLAIRAVALLVREFPNVACIIAGDTLGRPPDEGYLASLRALAIEAGVSERFAFVGFVDNVEDVSRQRTSSSTRRACRRARNGRARGARRRAARDLGSRRSRARGPARRPGCIARRAGSSAALASAISRLWRDDELRRTLVESGRERALRVFGQDQGTEAFSKVLSRGCRLGRRRARRPPRVDK